MIAQPPTTRAFSVEVLADLRKSPGEAGNLPPYLMLVKAASSPRDAFQHLFYSLTEWQGDEAFRKGASREDLSWPAEARRTWNAEATAFAAALLAGLRSRPRSLAEFRAACIAAPTWDRAREEEAQAEAQALERLNAVCEGLANQLLGGHPIGGYLGLSSRAVRASAACGAARVCRDPSYTPGKHMKGALLLALLRLIERWCSLPGESDKDFPTEVEALGTASKSFCKALSSLVEDALATSELCMGVEELGEQAERHRGPAVRSARARRPSRRKQEGLARVFRAFIANAEHELHADEMVALYDARVAPSKIATDLRAHHPEWQWVAPRDRARIRIGEVVDAADAVWAMVPSGTKPWAGRP